MADPFAAMLGLEVDDEQKMQALAQQLRGRQQGADMFALSTVPQIQKGAMAEQGAIMDEAQQVAGARDAMAQRNAAAEQSRLKRALDAQMQKERLAATAAEAAKDRLAEQQQSETLAGFGLKPAAKQIGNYNETTNLLDQIGQLEEVQAGFSEEQLKLADTPVGEVGVRFLENYGPEGVSRMAQEKLYGGDEAIMDWNAKGTRLTSRLSQLASGMAVTGYEMADRDKWSPWAPGVTMEGRERRLANSKDDLQRQRRTLYETHKGYFKKPEWMVRQEEAKEAEAQGARVEAAADAGRAEVIDPYGEMTDEEILARHEQMMREQERKRRAREARQMGASGQTADLLGADGA